MGKSENDAAIFAEKGAFSPEKPCFSDFSLEKKSPFML